MKIIRLRLCVCSPFAFVRSEMTSSIKLWRMLERGYNFTLYTHKTLCGYFCYVTIFYFYKHDCRAGKKKSLQSFEIKPCCPKPFFIYTQSHFHPGFKIVFPEYAEHLSSSLPSRSCEKSAEVSCSSKVLLLLKTSLWSTFFFCQQSALLFLQRRNWTCLELINGCVSPSCFNSWMWFIWNAGRKMKKKEKTGNNLH